jgi:hypothetical protein
VTLPVSDWARRAATLPAVLVEATPRAVRAGAEPLEQQARTNLRTASGGDLRLSRVRSGKGARVDVQVKLQGSGSGTRALVLPVGPVSLVEGDTKAHREPFTYSNRYTMNRRRKAARRGFISIPGVGIRTYVQHRGTRGQHPVGRAMDTAGRAAGHAGADVFARVIAEHLTN